MTTREKPRGWTWLTVAEAAKVYHVEPRRIRRAITGGKIRTERRGVAYLVASADVAALAICSTKTRYRDAIAAGLALAHWQKKDPSTSRKVPQRSYRCRVCGCWHLTSQPRRVELRKT